MTDRYAKLEPFYKQYGVTNDDPTDPVYFSAAVTIAITEFDIPVQDIADEFEVTKSTVHRWARGVSVPGPAVRESVLERMLKKYS